MVGREGDYLAVRCDDKHDIYVVERDIFYKTYDKAEIIENEETAEASERTEKPDKPEHVADGNCGVEEEQTAPEKK